jgi:hypothetical protein
VENCPVARSCKGCTVSGEGCRSADTLVAKQVVIWQRQGLPHETVKEMAADATWQLMVRAERPPTPLRHALPMWRASI